MTRFFTRLMGIGFAHLYLKKFVSQSLSDDKMDIQIYANLVQLELKLGSTASEQLELCYNYTTRTEMIEVRNLAFNFPGTIDC